MSLRIASEICFSLTAYDIFFLIFRFLYLRVMFIYWFFKDMELYAQQLNNSKLIRGQELSGIDASILTSSQA